MEPQITCECEAIIGFQYFATNWGDGVNFCRANNRTVFGSLKKCYENYTNVAYMQTTISFMIAYALREMNTMELHQYCTYATYYFLYDTLRWEQKYNFLKNMLPIFMRTII